MKRTKTVLKFICNFLTFFLLVAFVATSCMTLFVSTFSKTLNLMLTGENLNAAAKLTFGNVVLLSIAITLIDALRRKYTVKRPIKRITDAAQKITKGDFSVEIPNKTSIFTDPAFAEIGECFNKMAQELSGVETLRTDFIANVSHEMKTPLAVMQNYATLLQTPDLSDEKRMEYAKGIAENSRKTAEMMTNILRLNRLENQRIYPKNEEFDLSEQLCGCLLQFENAWESKNIELETEIEDGVTVKADEELLSLVWNNLFSNAFKFTPDGGTVEVKLTATEHHATVRVKDTGCGMTREVGEHIFEKFYQGDSSRNIGGNGLGLALVKRVVDIMKGEITVQSTPGEGSMFSVRIRRI